MKQPSGIYFSECKMFCSVSTRGGTNWSRAELWPVTVAAEPRQGKRCRPQGNNETTTFTVEKKLDQAVKNNHMTDDHVSVVSMLFPVEALALIVLLAYSIQETFPTCTSTPQRRGGVLTHLQTTDTNIHEVQRVPQSVYTGL